MQNPQNLIWIDLEMTGLDPDHDVIIEMATIVTDSDLNTLAEGPVIAIHHSDEVLARMDEWNTRTHGASGLTQRVKDSKVSMAEAEAQTIAFLEQWVPKASRRSVATVSARIAASSIATCVAWKTTSTIATSMSPRSKSWPRAGRQRCVTVSRKAARTWRWTTFANRSTNCVTIASTSSSFDRAAARLYRQSVRRPLWCLKQLVRLRAPLHGSALCC